MDRKAWLILAAASLAFATAATVLVLVRRSPWGEHFTEVPDLISDCYDRIRDMYSRKVVAKATFSFADALNRPVNVPVVSLGNTPKRFGPSPSVATAEPRFAAFSRTSMAFARPCGAWQ